MGSCSERNILKAIGEHGAPLVGYAKDATKRGANSQKFNCHKVGEFSVGFVAREGDLAKFVPRETHLNMDDLDYEEVENDIQFFSHNAHGMDDERMSTLLVGVTDPSIDRVDSLFRRVKYY